MSSWIAYLRQLTKGSNSWPHVTASCCQNQGHPPIKPWGGIPGLRTAQWVLFSVLVGIPFPFWCHGYLSQVTFLCLLPPRDTQRHVTRSVFLPTVLCEPSSPSYPICHPIKSPSQLKPQKDVQSQRWSAGTWTKRTTCGKKKKSQNDGLRVQSFLSIVREDGGRDALWKWISQDQGSAEPACKELGLKVPGGMSRTDVERGSQLKCPLPTPLPLLSLAPAQLPPPPIPMEARTH